VTRKVFQADFGSQADQMVLSPTTNPIHNGGFNIWQRGTSFVAAASGAYMADRWLYLNIAAAVHTIQRSTDVPAVAALVPLTNYSIHLDVTTADAAIAAGDLCAITQRIEGYAWAPFAQKVLTVGFWVKDTITGVHAVSLINAGSDRSCVMEYTVSVADTWEYKTVTFPASPSSGTWDYTTGIGAYLSFTLAAGSVYQTTAGAWQTTTDFYGTSAIVNSLSSTANNFKLWGVTMGLGTTVAPFWPRSFGEELALCQRYYTKTFPYATAPAQNAGVTNALEYWAQVAGIAQSGIRWEFPVTMRAVPTLTYYNPSAANDKFRDASLGSDAATATTSTAADHGVAIVQTQVVATVVGSRMLLHAQATADL
jgi:hypothetical protein